MIFDYLKDVMKILVLLGVIGLSCVCANAATNYGDYRSTPCVSIMEVAGDTMSNWQAGYSYNDMLLNSLKLGSNLSEKINMPLSEARLLTYRMADTAMKEPMHEVDFYKSIAVSKFSSEYYTICEMKHGGR